MRPHDSESSNDLLQAVLPNGGCQLVLVQAYFDESETQASEPKILTVAGYLFYSEQSFRFNRDAKNHLSKLGLTHFHQTDCANGRKEYEKLSKDNRIKAQKLLIGNIRRRTIMGCGANINVEQYEEIFKNYKRAPSAYAYAVISCLNIVRSWIERSKYEGDIAYFFESGFRDRSDADQFLNEILYTEDSKRDYRYISHTFAEKKKYKPLQAADMLAWFTNQEFTRIMRGKPDRRKDFEALLRPQDIQIDHTPESLTDLRRVLLEVGRI